MAAPASTVKIIPLSLLYVVFQQIAELSAIQTSIVLLYLLLMRAKRTTDLGSVSAALKPQIFTFSMKPRKWASNCLPDHTDFDGHINDHNIQEINWKPRIPTKKLLQQPRFLMSLERKKVRVINGLKESQFELKPDTSTSVKKTRIKIRKQAPKQKKCESQNFSRHNHSGYIHHEFLVSMQKQNKIPIINFNLQHLIEKRKTFKSEHGSRKKGSNNPYYAYISSDRFDRSRRHLDPNTQRSYVQSRDNSLENYPSMGTAEIRATIIDFQSS